eukprot:393479-Pelagomonas_calceolata.AAC.2
MANSMLPWNKTLSPHLDHSLYNMYRFNHLGSALGQTSHQAETELPQIPEGVFGAKTNGAGWAHGYLLLGPQIGAA